MATEITKPMTFELVVCIKNPTGWYVILYLFLKMYSWIVWFRYKVLKRNPIFIDIIFQEREEKECLK